MNKFEDNLEKLSEISEKFESGKLSLEESIKMFEESLSISADAIEYLKQCDAKVKKLKVEMDRLIEEN